MKPITTLDRTNLREIRTALQTAVEQVSKTYGIKATVGHASFLSDSATFKLEIATVSSDGTINTRRVSDFKALCGEFGLRPDHLGAVFTSGCTQYRISGLAIKSRRYPILAERISDGRSFKFPEEAVRSLVTSKKVAMADFVPRSGVVIGSRNPDHVKIVGMVAELRNENPEGYYADGEHRAAGMTEKQIYNMHYTAFARSIVDDRNGKGIKPMFGSDDVRQGKDRA